MDNQNKKGLLPTLINVAFGKMSKQSVDHIESAKPSKNKTRVVERLFRNNQISVEEMSMLLSEQTININNSFEMSSGAKIVGGNYTEVPYKFH